MSANWQERTKLILCNNKTKHNQLKKAHVLICGLGGVGAYAAEHICRVGVGEMTIVDGDRIMPSNRNRQLLALKSTEGKPKADLMANRLLDINPGLKLHVCNEFIRDQHMKEILDNPYDYVVDAIDTLSPKLYLLKHSMDMGHKIISSMGAGGKFDPEQVKVTDISKSYNCRLAYFIRKHLRRLDINKGFKVVFSPERVSKAAVIETKGEPNKKSTVGTISYMPAVFGCICASVVIRELINMGEDG
jgi:tRNA A37 threonylcarbamoyladenosine dehydratase